MSHDPRAAPTHASYRYGIGLAHHFEVSCQYWVIAAPPITQYWHDGSPPPDVAETIDSFRSNNPELAHRLYDERTAEALICDALGDREREAFRACAIPAMQADYFRYCAAFALGGVYADVDFRCTAPLAPWVEEMDGGELFDLPTAAWIPSAGEVRIVANSFFGFREPGHPLPAMAIEVATANIESRVVKGVWGTTGSGVLSSMRFLRDAGSLDAFLGLASGRPVEARARLLCEVVGDFTRVEQAFEGVRISPFERTAAWIAKAPGLAYKESDSHWTNSTTSIFK